MTPDRCTKESTGQSTERWCGLAEPSALSSQPPPPAQAHMGVISSSKGRCHGPMAHHECRDLPALYQRYLHSLQHSHHIPAASSIPRTPGRYDPRRRCTKESTGQSTERRYGLAEPSAVSSQLSASSAGTSPYGRHLERTRTGLFAVKINISDETQSREILGTKFSSSKSRCHGPMVHHECRNLPASYQRYLHSLQHSHHIPAASSILRTPGRYDSRRRCTKESTGRWYGLAEPSAFSLLRRHKPIWASSRADAHGTLCSKNQHL